MIVCLAVAGALTGGCMTKAEQEFIAADVKAISVFTQMSQTSNEFRADALEASGQVQQAEQLRADTRALASEVNANADARMEKLSVESQLVDSARSAVRVTRALIAAYDRYKARNTEVTNEFAD